MATDGTWCRRRSARLVSRVPSISRSAARSLAIRLLIRRRSVSSLVSPGPRPPMPTPPPARPPTCRDRLPPQPRSRCLRYCSWASSTWALPSALLACAAKMSRISAVRSMTLTLTRSSRLRSWAGRQLAVADHRVGAGGDHHLAELGDLAPADVGGRVGPGPPLDQALEHLRAGGLGQQLQLGDRVLGVDLAAGGPDADQHDPLQPQLAVLDLGDVGELGGHAGDPAQRLPVGEVQLVAVGIGPGTGLEPLHEQLVVEVEGVVCGTVIVIQALMPRFQPAVSRRVQPT